MNEEHKRINLMRLNWGWPVTADWAAASRSSGLTTCCLVLTGRYWIWPSWVTAIWQESQEREKSSHLSRRKTISLRRPFAIEETLIHFFTCSCTIAPSCSYWIICPSAIWETDKWIWDVTSLTSLQRRGFQTNCPRDPNNFPFPMLASEFKHDFILLFCLFCVHILSYYNYYDIFKHWLMILRRNLTQSK